MNFTAIDFETATSKNTSICSAGICVIESSEIVYSKEILVKPYPFEFNQYNIMIHKITPMAVKNAPNFAEVWDEIRPYVDGKIVIAHNARFDVGALRATLEMYGVEYPTFDYIDTVALSQKAYPDLPSHKLDRLSEALGIHFSHHHAMDDAYACAMVLEHIMEEYSIETLEELEEVFDIGIGHMYPGYVEPSRKHRRKKKSETKAAAEK